MYKETYFHEKPVGVFLANHNGDTGMRFWALDRWKRELSDLKKMGANTVWFIPFQFGQRTPEDYLFESNHWSLQRAICQEIIDLGMNVGIYSTLNDVFEKTLEENPHWKATNGTLFLEEGCACPSVEGAWQEILRLRTKVFSELPRIDYLMTPATDNGGCCCELCEDWPTIYLESYRKQAEICRKFHPDVKVVAASHALSIERHEKVEKILRQSPWVDYVADIPRGAGKPILKYYMNPETTMLGGWGKWGPCPILPIIERAIRSDTKNVVGQVQYVEGIHDDVNRFAIIRMASDGAATAQSVAEEYARTWLDLDGDCVREIGNVILSLGGGVWSDRTTYVDPNFCVPNPGADERVQKFIDLRAKFPKLVENYRYWLLHYRALAEAMNVIADTIPLEVLTSELVLCRTNFERLEPAYALWLSKLFPFLLPDQAPWVWPRSFHLAWKRELEK